MQYSINSHHIFSGIYSITNTIDKRIYIGSSKNIYKRYLDHCSYLKKNKHHNYHLQNFYNKYGLYSLIFNLVEYCEKEKLFEREQYYLNIYTEKFNICQKAVGGFDKHTEESKLKMSEQRKGVSRGLYSLEHRKALSVAVKNSKLCQDNLKKIQQKSVKTYFFLNPENKIMKITNLKKFCEENGLSDNKMILVNKGKRISHKNWKNINQKEKKKHPLYICILKYDLKNNLIDEFSSLEKALKSVNTTNAKYLKRCIKGELESFKGFIWKIR